MARGRTRIEVLLSRRGGGGHDLHWDGTLEEMSTRLHWKGLLSQREAKAKETRIDFIEERGCAEGGDMISTLQKGCRTACTGRGCSAVSQCQLQLLVLINVFNGPLPRQIRGL
jgi:hypothetical protein